MSEVAGGGSRSQERLKVQWRPFTLGSLALVTVRSPLAPWLGQESGWRGVGIRLIDAISRIRVCAPALDYFAWKTEHSFLVLPSSFLFVFLRQFHTLSRNVNQIARRVISEDRHAIQVF